MRDHTRVPLQGTFLHRIMAQGVAVKLQSESIHHMMMVEGAAAEVQLRSVLRLGVTAGVPVAAGAQVMSVTRGIQIMTCLHDTELSLGDQCCSSLNHFSSCMTLCCFFVYPRVKLSWYWLVVCSRQHEF